MLQVNTGPAPFDVCVVGSSNLDLVVTAPRHPVPGETLIGTAYHEYPGGKGLNQVVAASRAGARAAFVSALGDDAAGQRLAGVLADEDIDATAVQWLASTATGRALITVDASGENSIVVIPGANADLQPAPLPEQIDTVFGGQLGHCRELLRRKPEVADLLHADDGTLQRNRKRLDERLRRLGEADGEFDLDGCRARRKRPFDGDPGAIHLRRGRRAFPNLSPNSLRRQLNHQRPADVHAGPRRIDNLQQVKGEQ